MRGNADGKGQPPSKEQGKDESGKFWGRIRYLDIRILGSIVEAISDATDTFFELLHALLDWILVKIIWGSRDKSSNPSSIPNETPAKPLCESPPVSTPVQLAQPAAVVAVPVALPEVGAITALNAIAGGVTEPLVMPLAYGAEELHAEVDKADVDPEKVSTLLESGADSNSKDRSGKTPLFKMVVKTTKAITTLDSKLSGSARIPQTDMTRLGKYISVLRALHAKAGPNKEEEAKAFAREFLKSRLGKRHETTVDPEAEPIAALIELAEKRLETAKATNIRLEMREIKKIISTKHHPKKVVTQNEEEAERTLAIA